MLNGCFFKIGFESGVFVEARLCEETLVSSFYKNPSVYESFGCEVCIVLDVALAAGGCEAVVEGFYSLVKAHKKPGGQGNEMLVKRTVVDWTLPDPLTCPKTMEEIGKLFTEGSKKLGLPKHQMPIFSDVRRRAARRYNVSQVVDRLRIEPPKCPHVVKADL